LHPACAYERLKTITGCDHLVSPQAQVEGDQFDDIRFIIHDEYFLLHRTHSRQRTTYDNGEAAKSALQFPSAGS
jgi:hypothetical protein